VILIRPVFLLLLAGLLGFSQTASMPAAVPTDSDLFVAFDRAETKLSSGIDASTLTLPVFSGAVFPLQAGQATLVTIENEQVKICSRSGNTLTACVGGRGFGGTFPSAHTSDKPVIGRISAWYHNRSRVEMEAIASAVRANASDISALATQSASTYKASTYNFTPIAIGGSISAGFSATVSVPSCPAGMSGSAANYYVYLSGGTGTAEAVLVTGGTCSGDLAAGTLIFTPANSHSGAWTISPASIGIQEAINANPGGGVIDVGPGTASICGTVNVPSNFTIAGAGMATKLVPCSSTMIMFSAVQGTQHVRFRDLLFSGRTVAISNTVTAIKALYSFYLTVDNVEFDDIGTALLIDRCFTVQTVNLRLIDNTTLFAGSTTDGTGPYGYGNYTFDFTAVNVKHMTDVNTFTLSLARPAVIIAQRVVNSSIVNFTTQGLFGQYDGIRVLNDTQGLQVIGGVIVGAANGLYAMKNTVGITTASPGWLHSVGTSFDQSKLTAFKLESAYLNTIADCSVTARNPRWGTELAGIMINLDSWGNTVTNCRFDAIAKNFGVSILDTAFDNSITNNFFVNNWQGVVDPASANIFMNSTANPNNNRITGNRRAAWDLTPAFILNTSTGSGQIIRDNGGIDDVTGADLPSASAIIPSNPVHRVSGTAAINSVLRTTTGAGGAFTGTVTLIPTGAWTLTTAGNIGAASTAIVGKPMTLTWLDSTSKWYPSY
jgi:hypothetical protein